MQWEKYDTKIGASIDSQKEETSTENMESFIESLKSHETFQHFASMKNNSLYLQILGNTII